VEKILDELLAFLYADETMQDLNNIYISEQTKNFINSSMDFASDFGLAMFFANENPLLRELMEERTKKFSVYVEDTTYKQLKESLMEGFLAGESETDLAKRVNDVMSLAKRQRAATIARTETFSVVNQAHLETMRMNGIEWKEWLTAGDEKVRENHRAANGQIVRVDEYFIVGGEYLMYPGDPRGSAENVISCRCLNIPAIYTKQVNESKRTLIGVASTEVVDRYNDIIKQDGWILDNFRKNPVMLWSHNYNEPPIAKITDIRIENNQLIFEAQFPKKGVNELSDKIFEFYKEGLLNAFSVSFIPIKYEHNEYGGYTYTQQELLEISAVTVPANQEALAMAFKSMDEESQYKLLKSLGIKTLNLEEVFKGAVPSHESQKLDENSAWDATEAVTKLRKWASSDGTGDKDTIDWAKYKWGFAWYEMIMEC